MKVCNLVSTFNIQYNIINFFLEYPQNLEFRRNQGLISFSRSGRSGLQGIQHGIRAGNAMWFGPRLGRVQ